MSAGRKYPQKARIAMSAIGTNAIRFSMAVIFKDFKIPCQV